MNKGFRNIIRKIDNWYAKNIIGLVNYSSDFGETVAEDKP